MSNRDDRKSKLIIALCKDASHWIRKIMDRRAKGIYTDDKKRAVMFDLLLKPDDKRGFKPLNLEQLIDEAFLFLVAGIDTTSYALSCATFHILHTPGVLTKLREELLRVSGREKGRFEWKHVQNLPYLVSV